MKKFLTIAVAAPLCGIGLGLTRGWFAFSKAPDPENNRDSIVLTVDPRRMKSDLETLKDLLALTAGVLLLIRR